MSTTKKRKKNGLMGIIILCLLSITACKKEEKEPEVPVQEAWTKYSPKNVQTYTIDAEGNLYFFDLIIAEGSDELKLEKYDKEGNPVFSRSLDASEFSMLTAMAENDGVLYFTSAGFDGQNTCTMLYAYHIETEEISLIERFEYFERVNRLLVNEDCIYLLGSNQFSMNINSAKYSYHGEKVMGYDQDEADVFELGVEEPIDISLDENGNLVIYAHMDDAFCLLAYNAELDTAKVLAKNDTYKMNSMAICNSGESVLYYSINEDVVVSDLSNLDVESELYPNGNFLDIGICFKNGRVACMTMDRKLVQFSLDEVKKENQTIRYIYSGYEPETPYGCGYEIQRSGLNEDKFALKVLAMDSDYDLCLVDTSYDLSYNLKQNGVFYPLNDVPGVQEYLDACFPYVREAATDEDGNVWMLPITVNLPRFVVDEEGMKQQNLSFRSDMTYEEYFQLHACLPEEERKLIWIPEVALYNDFIRQYFTYYTSADTEEFCEGLTSFARYWSYITEDDSTGWKEALYLYSNRDDVFFEQYVEKYGDDTKVYEVPKVSSDSKNVGTCLFLAVNPYSNNLDATLSYISSWIAYTMKREDTPLFFKDRVVGDSVYETSLYELYENGEIGFTLDYDVYMGYDAVLQDISKLEAYIRETERKLKIYLNE